MTTIFYTLMMYLVFFFLVLSYIEEENNGKKKLSRKTDTAFIIVLAVALFARIMMANVTLGHRADMACFKMWAERLASVGTHKFYEPGYFADYPPLYMLVLFVIGKIRAIFNIASASSAFSLLIKMPAILSDIAIGALIYFVGKERIGSKSARTFAMIFVFSPIIILNSTFWGQMDSLFTLVLVLSLMFLYKEKYYWAAFLYVLCALIKPQAFIVAPVYLCAYFRTKDFKMIGKCILIGIGTVFVVALPFTNNWNFMWLIEKYKNTLASYPYATVNAYNLFALFNYNWKPITSKFLLMPISYWSNLIIFLTTAASALFYFKAKDKSKIFYMGYMIITSIFTVGAKMHERYFFPALVLLAVTYIYKKDKRLIYLFVGQTIAHYLNVGHVFTDDLAGVNMTSGFGALIFLVSIIHIALFAYSIKLAIDIFITEKKREVKLTSVKQPLVKDAFAFAKMIKIDYMIMAIITIVYSIIAFVNLGDTKAPQTFYQTQSKPFEVDLGEVKDISSVMLYLGIGDSSKNYKIDYSVDGAEWQSYSSVNHQSVFLWIRTGGQASARYLTVTDNNAGMMLGEIAVMGADGKPLAITSSNNLICDEQSVVPLKPTYMNGTFFDEIYHPRTAYEILHKMAPYEVTHPPLGKLFLSIGIWMFGMVPFGWRLMGTIAGILMVPVFYLLCKKLFGKTTFATMGTIIFAFDFMHFMQTRMATIDSYAVLFIMLMYYFIIDYLALDFNNEPLKKGLKSLFLTGLVFGIGAATKWICLYAALGLIVILCIVWIRAWIESQMKKDIKDFASKFWKTVGWCVLCFVLIPMVIYYASYLPQIRYDLHGRGAAEYVVQNQDYMLNYHKGVKETHPFSSKWYEWIIDKRPLWGYVDGELAQQNIVSSISSFGNPAVWWVGIFGLFACLYYGIKKRSNIALVILTGYFAQLLPWLAVSRILFIYHYFACVPFLVLAIVYAMKYLQEQFNVSDKALWCYCGVVVLMFVLFYPVISGYHVPKWYVVDYLKWFSSWNFIN